MEIWKHYKKHYWVSNQGRIKSTFGNKETIFHQFPSNTDYLRVYIATGSNYKHRKNESVHRLVAEMFVPNPLNLPQVNHKDGNKQNNNDWNLEWSTQKENINHSINILGNLMGGENCGKHKLIQPEVDKIREKYSKGNYSYKMLADEYNVCIGNIGRIINNKIWKQTI